MCDCIKTNEFNELRREREMIDRRLKIKINWNANELCSFLGFQNSNMAENVHGSSTYTLQSKILNLKPNFVQIFRYVWFCCWCRVCGVMLGWVSISKRLVECGKDIMVVVWFLYKFATLHLLNIQNIWVSTTQNLRYDCTDNTTATLITWTSRTDTATHVTS